jgi:hypothetical protein
MIRTEGKRPREVLRAQRVFREITERDPFGHIHLHAQLRQGNPYAIAKLEAEGCAWDTVHGAIRTAAEEVK